MNAFKKELAGMLLDSKQTFDSMEQIVSGMDEIFTNLSLQIDYKDETAIWETFISSLAACLCDKIVATCISEDMDVWEGSKSMIDIFILLEKAVGSEYECMLVDGVNDKYAEYYISRKEALLK